VPRARRGAPGGARPRCAALRLRVEADSSSPPWSHPARKLHSPGEGGSAGPRPAAATVSTLSGVKTVV
jgi:hypothetical protein